MSVLRQLGTQKSAGRVVSDETPGVCSKCHANTVAFMDPYEQELMTVCCWARLERPDREADE